jgi:hypothetical protein
MSLRPSALTDAIDEAFRQEWTRDHPNPLPEAGSQDRRLLFAAVARGLLTYLEANHNEIFETITLKTEGADERTYTVTATDLDIVIPPV